MASLEQRKGNYRVVFRLNSHKFSRSLRTENETAAVASLARLEDNLRRVELGTLEIPANADIATFLLSDGKQAGRVDLPGVTKLNDLFDRFFNCLPDGNLESSTITTMKVHRGHLQRILGSTSRVESLARDDLQGYINARTKESGQRGRRVQPATVKKEIATLRGLWNWGKVKGSFPNEGLRYPKEIEKPPFQTWKEIERHIRTQQLTDEEQADLWDCLFLSTDEINQLLVHVKETARQPFIYPMVATAAFTGARRSELLRCQIHDVGEDTLLIHERKRVKGRQSTRRVPISRQLRETLAGWLATHPGGRFLFCQHDVVHSSKRREAPNAVTKDEASDHFKRTLQDSKWEVIRGWHIFRHSFCSNCALKGVDQRMIDAWIGHTTESMRRRYRHLFPTAEKQAMGLVFG